METAETETTEFERSLLGSIVLDPTRIPEVAELITGADFHDCHLGHIFDVAVTCHEAGGAVSDPKLLLAELRRNHVDHSVANPAFLGRLFIESVPYHAKHYALAIRRASLLRQQADLARAILDRTEQHDADPEAISAWAESQLSASGGPESFPCRPIGEVAVEYVGSLERRDPWQATVMSGIVSLDETSGGWAPGELITLAARTGVGKTALALQIASHVAMRGKPVLFASLEMRDAELVNRVLCGNANVNSRRIRGGRYDANDLERLRYQADQIRDDPLYVWSPPRATTARIRGMAKRLQATVGLSLLVVDYIGLVQPADRRRQRYEQVGQVTGDLKAMAKELCVPVLALCQLNRDADGARPRLSHMRESGSVEQDSDVVLFVHRDNEQSRGAELIIAKHRHSSCGKLTLTWEPERCKFGTTEVF